MEVERLDIEKESKIIVQSIDETIVDFQKCLDKYEDTKIVTEALLQFRLYYPKNNGCDRGKDILFL